MTVIKVLQAEISLLVSYNLPFHVNEGHASVKTNIIQTKHKSPLWGVLVWIDLGY